MLLAPRIRCIGRHCWILLCHLCAVVGFQWTDLQRHRTHHLHHRLCHHRCVDDILRGATCGDSRHCLGRLRIFLCRSGQLCSHWILGCFHPIPLWKEEWLRWRRRLPRLRQGLWHACWHTRHVRPWCLLPVLQAPWTLGPQDSPRAQVQGRRGSSISKLLFRLPVLLWPFYKSIRSLYLHPIHHLVVLPSQ